MGTITRLVLRTDAWQGDTLFAQAYDELCLLARLRLYRGAATATTGTLLHDSWQRLLPGVPARPERGAFFRFAARALRAMLGAPRTPAVSPDEVRRLHSALQALARHEPLLADVLQMRHFGGFDDARIAQRLGLTEHAVRRCGERGRTLLQGLLQA